VNSGRTLNIKEIFIEPAVGFGSADATTSEDARVLLVMLSIFLKTVGVSIIYILRDVRFCTDAALNTAATDMFVLRKPLLSVF
jgi:hypothetical protein